MPVNISGQGTIWNLPNYAGELFTADAINTPLLNMIGGISGGKQTANFEFPIASTYAMPTAAQPAITETASLTAPTAIGYVRDQQTNVTQIFQEKVSISYEKIANGGRLSGLNSAGQDDNVPSEKDFQIARALEKIARDVEYTFINGVYQVSTSAAVANKSRGLIPLCATGNTLAGGAVQLTKAMMQTILKTMFTNGAVFKDMVIWVNAFQKQMISALYGYAPTDRTVGGVNIKQIETDFGSFGIALNRFMPADTVLFADMVGIEPIFQPVPEKGNFFYESLAKTGASEDGQIYGKVGLNHGVGTLHGTITGLATS